MTKKSGMLVEILKWKCGCQGFYQIQFHSTYCNNSFSIIIFFWHYQNKILYDKNTVKCYERDQGSINWAVKVSFRDMSLGFPP